MTTFQGDGTSDEMCFGFLTVYPAQNIPIPFCTAWKSIPQCSIWQQNTIDGCSIAVFGNASHSSVVQLRKEVLKRCAPFGNCLEECKEYVKTLKTTHPCLMNDVGHLLRSYHTKRNIEMATFYVALDSCNAEIQRDECQCGSDRGCDIGAASGSIVSSLTMFSALLMLYIFK